MVAGNLCRTPENTAITKLRIKKKANSCFGQAGIQLVILQGRPTHSEIFKVMFCARVVQFISKLDVALNVISFVNMLSGNTVQIWVNYSDVSLVVRV